MDKVECEGVGAVKRCVVERELGEGTSLSFIEWGPVDLRNLNIPGAVLVGVARSVGQTHNQ